MLLIMFILLDDNPYAFRAVLGKPQLLCLNYDYHLLIIDRKGAHFTVVIELN